MVWRFQDGGMAYCLAALNINKFIYFIYFFDVLRHILERFDLYVYGERKPDSVQSKSRAIRRLLQDILTCGRRGRWHRLDLSTLNKKLSRERTLHKISRFEMGFWISFYFFKKRFERLSNIWILWWASWAKLPVSWNSYVAPLFWVFTRRNIICHLFTACIRVHKNLIVLKAHLRV